jgi:hypothetical protein
MYFDKVRWATSHATAPHGFGRLRKPGLTEAGSLSRFSRETRRNRLRELDLCLLAIGVVAVQILQISYKALL